MTFARKLRLVVSLMLLLSACQATDTDRKSKNLNGTVLGDKNWHSISISESKFSISGDAIRVGKILANDLPNRRQESVTLTGLGKLYFEQKHVSGFQLPGNVEDYLLRQFDMGNRQHTLSATTKSRMHSGIVRYFVYSDSGKRCLLFSLIGNTPNFQGKPSEGQFNAHIDGYGCQLIGDSEQGLVEQMLDLVSRLRFDNGKLNQRRAAT